MAKFKKIIYQSGHTNGSRRLRKYWLDIGSGCSTVGRELRSLPTTEISGSNPVMGNFHLLSTALKRRK